MLTWAAEGGREEEAGAGWGVVARVGEGWEAAGSVEGVGDWAVGGLGAVGWEAGEATGEAVAREEAGVGWGVGARAGEG